MVPRLPPLLTGNPKKRKPKRSPSYDPQRSAVYLMEREIVGMCVNHTSPRKALVDLTEHVCERYNVPAPRVNITNQPDTKLFGWCDVYTGRIVLNRGFHGANVSTLLHELAHWLVDWYYPEATEWHGPQFMAFYMRLLDQYRLLPMDAFKVMAARRQLKIARRLRSKPKCLVL